MAFCSLHFQGRTPRLFHLALAGWFLAVALVPTALAAEEYSFAVVPQFERRKMFAIWQPIVNELQKRAGVKLKLETTLTVAEYGQNMRKGAYDFIYTNPYYVLKFHPTQGYNPLVRDAKNLRGVVVVRNDSPIRIPEDLDGKTLAVPSLNAFGASLMVQADLENKFHVKMKIKDAKSHTSAYFQTINGLVDAAGGVQKTLEEQEPAVREALRVVYTTGELTSHPIAAHPRVPRQAQEKIRESFLAMAADPAMKPFMEKIPMQKAVTTSINDYLPAAKLGLERYWVEE